jgi:hypothetical protein
MSAAGVDGRPLPERNQIGEVLVLEQLLAMVGEKGVDRAFLDRAPTEGRRVEKWVMGI